MRAKWPSAEILDARDCVITPGLINAHQHLTGDPLIRSLVPDLQSSEDAIFQWAVPIHGAHTADDDALAATLCAVEAVRYGTTTLIEAGTVANPLRVAASLNEVGMRATVGCWGWDVAGLPYAAPADEVLERQRDLVRAFPKGGLVEGWVTLVGHDLASDALLAGAAALARAEGAGMTMHLSPTPADAKGYAKRSGLRPMLHLEQLGVLGPHLLLAHCVWLDDREIETLISSQTGIAFCPWAYLRLGQGVTVAGRHAEVLEREGRMALGCDSVNAGDLPDVLRAAALAVGLMRDKRLDPMRFGAGTALELATIRGAEAIGMADRIGSLEVGKYADIVVHDPKAPSFMVPGDHALNLIWGSDGRSVRDVVINGRIIVRDNHCVSVDEDMLRREAKQAQKSLLKRSGREIQPRWPISSG